MKKLNQEKIKKIIKKIKPFWKKYSQLRLKHFKELRLLEEKMNKEIKEGIDLEFFYVDGECVGIGAENYLDRKKFPLIQDREFYND